MSVEAGTATGTEPQQVFICYRREDTAPYAGRIYDAVVSQYGADNVFMDLDLDPGVDFVDRITRVVSGCVALIVVIGPSWAEVQNEDGTRRIEDPEDFVRLEVETGLRRDDVMLLPLLVGGARMPRREDLPPEMQKLARHNALELSHARWKHDVGRLLGTLDEVLPDRAGPEPLTPPPVPEPPTPVPRDLPPLGWRLTLEGMLIAGATAGVARLIGQAIPLRESAEVKKAVRLEEPISDGEALIDNAQHIVGLAGRRTVTLALVGGALAIWLARRVWRMYPLRHLLRGLLIGAAAGLVGGVIWGLRVYLPEETVSFATRANWDILSGAISGGILASLIGWFWRPPRIGPAILAGAVGGVLVPLFVVVYGWRNTTPTEAALSFALGAAAITGVTVAAMLLADRAEAGGTQAAAGSPRSGASQSGGSTAGM